MEQALSGLGLCPRSAELASPWHTGLLEAPRVLPGDQDSYGLAGLFDIGSPDQPPPSAVTAPPGSPHAGVLPPVPGEYSLWGDGSSDLDRGTAAASTQVVPFVQGDPDVLSSDSETLCAYGDDYGGLVSQAPVVGGGPGWGDQSVIWLEDTVIHRPPELSTRGRARVRPGNVGVQSAPTNKERGNVVIIEDSDGDDSQVADFKLTFYEK